MQEGNPVETMSEGQDDAARITGSSETLVPLTEGDARRAGGVYRSQREVDAAFAKRLAAERRKWAGEADARLAAEREQLLKEADERLETEHGLWRQGEESRLAAAREEAEANAIDRIRSRNQALPDVLRSTGAAPGASPDYANMPPEQFLRLRRDFEAQMRMGKKVKP